MQAIRRKFGFVLIETITYLGVVAIIAVIVTQTISLIARPLIALRESGRTFHAASVVLDRMTREIRAAAAINGAESVLGASPGALALDTGVRFAVAGGVLTVRDASGATSPLTAGSAEVTALTFHSVSSGRSEAVKVEMVLGGRTFSTAAVMRGSY